MALVLALVDELKPSTWTNESYANKRYVQVPLSRDSEEYDEICSEFQNQFHFKIASINRIQHPFAFCRFKLRQRHLFYQKGTMPEEGRKFFRLTDDANVNVVLEYNCDERRDTAFMGPHRSGCSKYIVVAKTFRYHNFNERDSHRFPEYLIECDLSTQSEVDRLQNMFKTFGF